MEKPSHFVIIVNAIQAKMQTFTLDTLNFFSDNQDILENEDIKLDNMFIASLVADIIRVSSISIYPISSHFVCYDYNLDRCGTDHQMDGRSHCKNRCLIRVIYRSLVYTL